MNEARQVLTNLNALGSLSSHQFRRLCCPHLTFAEFQPCAKNLTGALLVSNPYFHYLWTCAFRKDSQVSWSKLAPIYYQTYKSQVLQNQFHYFFEAVTKFQQGKQDEDEDTSSSPKNIQFERLPAGQILFSTFQNLKSPNIDENMSPKLRQESQPRSSEQLESAQSHSCSALDDAFISSSENETLEDESMLTSEIIKESCLKTSKCPKSGRLIIEPFSAVFDHLLFAEIACLFLQVDKVYLLQEVVVHQILESYSNAKFQFAIFKGSFFSIKNSTAHSHSELQSESSVRIFVAVRNIFGFEQLLRLKALWGNPEAIIVWEGPWDLLDHRVQTDSRCQQATS